MSKTLEETKAYIIEFAETHKLNEKTINQILEDIKTDKNGLVPDMEYASIIGLLYDLVACRESTIRMLERNKQLREKDKERRLNNVHNPK